TTPALDCTPAAAHNGRSSGTASPGATGPTDSSSAGGFVTVYSRTTDWKRTASLESRSATRTRTIFFGATRSSATAPTESAAPPPHTRSKNNAILANGRKTGTAGILIKGEPDGLIFEGNSIRDTREDSRRTQTVGIQIEKRVGSVRSEANQIEAAVVVDDHRG